MITGYARIKGAGRAIHAGGQRLHSTKPFPKEEILLETEKILEKRAASCDTITICAVSCRTALLVSRTWGAATG